MKLTRVGSEADAQMRDLVARAFPNNPKSDAAMTRWQWWDNPFGETLAWAWTDEGRVVAQYVGFCAPGLLGGTPCTLTLGVDAAVAPDYQGRRLFTPLSRALYDDANAHEWPLIAYPNDLSAAGIARAGWCEVARLRVFARPLNDRWLAGRAHAPRALVRVGRRLLFAPPRRTGATVAVSDSVPDDIEALWSAVRARDHNGIARGEPWWRWRYDAHPARPYRFLAVRRGGHLVAAAATRIRAELGGEFVALLELLAVDDAAAAELMGAIEDGALGAADGVALTAIAGSTLARRARAAGLRGVPARWQPRPVRFGVVAHPTLVPEPAALEWSTAWGDLDHV